MSRVFSVWLFATLVAIGCSEPAPTGLDGRWQTRDYECFGQAPDVETVDVVVRSEQVVATKVIGDPCVPSGAVTFRGELGEDGSRGQVDCMVGEPDSPSNGSFEGTIEIESDRAFTACRMKFVRAS